MPYKYRDYSHIAAEASLAAGDQGKYWEMHAKLFESPPARDGAQLLPQLVGQAQGIGLDVAKFRGLDTTELGRLVNGRHSLLDIRKMLEAQAPVKADLQQVVDYAGVLVKAGLIEMPAPAASGRKPARK